VPHQVICGVEGWCLVAAPSHLGHELVAADPAIVNTLALG
jgi:hypothetical protein